MSHFLDCHLPANREQSPGKVLETLSRAVKWRLVEVNGQVSASSIMTRHLACSHTDLLSEFCKGQAINIKHHHCYPWWLDTQADTRVSRGQHGDGSGVQSQLAQFLKNAQDSLETIETFKQWPILQSGNSKTFYQYNWIQIRFAFFFKHCQILTIPKGEITANRRQRLDLVQHLLYLTLC